MKIDAYIEVGVVVVTWPWTAIHESGRLMPVMICETFVGHPMYCHLTVTFGLN